MGQQKTLAEISLIWSLLSLSIWRSQTGHLLELGIKLIRITLSDGVPPGWKVTRPRIARRTVRGLHLKGFD